MDDSDSSICCLTSSSSTVGDPSHTSTSNRLSKRRSRRYNVTKVGNKQVVSNSNQQASTHSLKPNAPQAPPKSYSFKHAATLSVAKILFLLLTQFPLRAAAYPVLGLLKRENATFYSSEASSSAFHALAKSHREPPMDPRDYWLNMGISAMLVLLGGIFAGLTLGLMGQDEIYLQVIQQSGEPSEKKAAGKVLSLLNRGKHWVLVTLLLSNVVTNESLPIVLDRVLGGGWPAVVSSTVAIVIFGEIIPQSVSVRYGLSVGAWFAPFVLALMYLMYPIAYPVAMLLDYTLGEDHGTIYKRAGLKTLVGLHGTMGVERLNDDEVTIISAVLDLKDKPVALIMTPMEDVFTMSANRILDEPTIEEILHSGFNRIPIHSPDEPTNFIGMLLVRTLITYDPEDNFPISSFPLATLPETGPETSCLNILNYFQEGKSHMVVVSRAPGASTGALGVLTLEDVIEELIGEEIIDESDVYVDVHKAIRRSVPGPLSKAASLALFRHSPRASIGYDDDGIRHRLNPLNKASNPKTTTNANITIKRSNLESLTAAGGSPSANGSSSRPDSDGASAAHWLIDVRSPTDTSPILNHHNNTNSKGDYVPSNLSKISSGRAESPVPINNQLLPPPDGNYGTIHRTEQGAIDEAIQQNSTGRYGEELLHNYHDSRPDSRPDEEESEVDDNVDASDLSYRERIVHDSSPELHSYRTGGIIESIINVDGVSKTIIEDASTGIPHGSYMNSSNLGAGHSGYENFEDAHTNSSSSSTSSKSKKDPESQRLI